MQYDQGSKGDIPTDEYLSLNQQEVAKGASENVISQVEVKKETETIDDEEYYTITNNSKYTIRIFDFYPARGEDQGYGYQFLNQREKHFDGAPLLMELEPETCHVIKKEIRTKSFRKAGRSLFAIYEGEEWKAKAKQVDLFRHQHFKVSVVEKRSPGCLWTLQIPLSRGGTGRKTRGCLSV